MIVNGQDHATAQGTVHPQLNSIKRGRRVHGQLWILELSKENIHCATKLAAETRSTIARLQRQNAQALRQWLRF